MAWEWGWEGQEVRQGGNGRPGIWSRVITTLPQEEEAHHGPSSRGFLQVALFPLATQVGRSLFFLQDVWAPALYRP